MNVSTIADLISAAALTFGLIFAIVQLRHYRYAREREIALELLRSFQTPEMASALRTVYNLPSGLTKAEVEAHLGDRMDLVYSLMTTWESIGILVHRGEISLALVDDFFSGPIRISWQKLQSYVHEERREQNRGTIEEWFEWLNDRMAERESNTPPVPAHVAHAGWKGTD
jgi:hypothetical protein